MSIEYSKPSADIGNHTLRLLARNAELLARQRTIVSGLNGGGARSTCLVCAGPLAGRTGFPHRATTYVVCPACGHVQSAVVPPSGYTQQYQTFSEFYDQPDESGFRRRRDAVFVPKREWVRRAAASAGLGDLLGRSWVELGCGDGCFLDALREAGASRVLGLDAELRLAQKTQERLGLPITHFTGSLGDAVRAHPADVYVGWFVLEHCFEIPDFLDALRARPPGTLFAFSVPTFGLAGLIEMVLGDHFARSLDSVLHLQLFTDASIRHAMDQAGFRIVAEWIFGQDADDLYRALVTRLSNMGALHAVQDEVHRFAAAIDGMQSAIDRARLSDARHILAVRQ
jgi:2-polyprenyl-3-methyl-5-hydroxy-6-metoxy-1,4-benzoquinol methylase